MAGLAAALLGAGPLVAPSHSARAQAADVSPDTLVQLDDVLPARLNNGGVVPPMIVDPVNHLGFAIGIDPMDNGASKLAMYDLKSLKLLDLLAINQAVSVWIYGFVVDPDRQRLIDAGTHGGVPAPCGIGANQPATYSYAPDGMGNRKLTTGGGALTMPCGGADRFAASSGSIFYDQGGRAKLLLTGTSSVDGARIFTQAASIDTSDNDGAALLVRQVDLETMGGDNWQESLDWEIDLRYSGCGRREVFFARRVADSVLTYCSDPRAASFNLLVGDQGYVVRIPLDDQGAPITDALPEIPDPRDPGGEPLGPDHLPSPLNPIQAPEALKLTQPGYVQGWAREPYYDESYGSAVVRKTPALPGQIFPFVDPESGSLLLLTANASNGNAVWAFDPLAERFVGLVTGGAVAPDEGTRTAAGFDPVRGRAYLLTSSGILMVPMRERPLPAGKVHPVVTARRKSDGTIEQNSNTVKYRDIAVDPGLRRLFVPVTGVGYVVVEDHVPDPPAAKASDPDLLTRQVDEVPGMTETDRSGRAFGAGARVLVTGGIPRFVNQADPFCLPIHSLFEPHQATGQLVFERRVWHDCLASLLISKGNRQFSLGYTFTETGSTTGSVADAAGLFVPSTDRATDADVREAGRCGSGVVSGLVPRDAMSNEDFRKGFTQFLDGYHKVCSGAQDGVSQLIGEDLRQGTQGGDGFPVPTAACTDFARTPNADVEPRDPPKDLVFTATAACDTEEVLASAAASAGGINLPLGSSGDGVPLAIDVAQSWSSSRSFTASNGYRTEVTAVAEGVGIGPLTIGRIVTTATVRTKGRTGTARAGFERLWCQISVTLPEGVSLPTVPQEAAPGVPAVVTDDCVDPDADDDPRTPETENEIRSLIDDLNQTLGKVRIGIPDVDRHATPGGYQAVVTKNADVRAADQAVNEDDGFTVPGLEVVVYNDGRDGRSRLVLQLAGVHAESRYSIVAIPDVNVPDIPELTFDNDSVVEALRLVREGSPARFETIPGVPASFRGGGGGAPSDNPLARFFNAPAQFVRDFLNWLTNNPREAALLFMFFSILATPIYLFLRRRAFEQAMAE